MAEAPTSNVFWVDAGGILRTPPEEHVLLGVTRLSILEIAKHDGIECVECPVRPDELAAAAEVFLTGTTAGIWPVASIDDRPIGAHVPGPVSSRLRERFVAVSCGRDADFHHWLTFTDAA